MIGRFAAVDELQLQRMRTMETEQLTELLDQLCEEGAVPVLELDELWDALHFYLTGYAAADPSGQGLPLSQAVMGSVLFREEEEGDYLAYTHWHALGPIVEQLRSVEPSQRDAAFSQAKARRAQVYLGDWREMEDTLLVQSLSDGWEDLLCFYERALDERRSIVVGIY